MQSGGRLRSAYLPQTPTQRLRDHEATLDMLGETRLLAGLRDADAASFDDEDDDEDDDDAAQVRERAPRRGFVASLDDTGSMPIASAARNHA